VPLPVVPPDAPLTVKTCAAAKASHERAIAAGRPPKKTTFLHGPLYVSVADMTDAAPPDPNPAPNTDAGSDADFDDLLAFTPVPMQRRRADGWSAERQRRFITALSVMGAVGPAARAVGMGRASAYRLRERAGAAGFAEAWDIAIACGADLQFHTALDQAINGVTTVRVMRGGMVEVMNAPDRKFLNAALLSKTRLSAALSAQAQAVKATRET
jgi:hypothetical protein